jgi:hypothetical protein
MSEIEEILCDLNPPPNVGIGVYLPIQDCRTLMRYVGELQAAESERDAALEQVETLRAALENLTSRLREVHEDERYRAVWACAQLRYGPYTGATYTAELEAAEDALTSPAPSRLESAEIGHVLEMLRHAIKAHVMDGSSDDGELLEMSLTPVVISEVKESRHQTCCVCHRRDRFNFTIPDDEWMAIIPDWMPAGGSLCLNCVDELAASKNITYTLEGPLYFAGDMATLHWGYPAPSRLAKLEAVAAHRGKVLAVAVQKADPFDTGLPSQEGWDRVVNIAALLLERGGR